MKKIIILLVALLCTMVLFAQDIDETRVAQLKKEYVKISLIPIVGKNTLQEQLVKSSSEGDLESVIALLSIPKISVNERYNGETPLLAAAYAGHLHIAKELLKHKRIRVDKTGNLDVTPLIAATIGGYTELVREILKHSPRVNKRDADGYTALMWAAKKGYLDIAKILLAQKDIEVNVLDEKKNDNALLLAYKNNYRELALEILNTKPRNSGDYSISATYWNHKDLYGNSILTMAARNNDTKVIELLLEINHNRNLIDRALDGPVVNINITDNDKNTPIMLAAKYGYVETVKILLAEKGIDLEKRNIFQQTVFDLASTQEVKDVLNQYMKAASETQSKALKNKIKRGLINPRTADTTKLIKSLEGEIIRNEMGI